MVEKSVYLFITQFTKLIPLSSYLLADKIAQKLHVQKVTEFSISPCTEKYYVAAYIPGSKVGTGNVEPGIIKCMLCLCYVYVALLYWIFTKDALFSRPLFSRHCDKSNGMLHFLSDGGSFRMIMCFLVYDEHFLYPTCQKSISGVFFIFLRASHRLCAFISTQTLEAPMLH